MWSFGPPYLPAVVLVLITLFYTRALLCRKAELVLPVRLVKAGDDPDPGPRGKEEYMLRRKCPCRISLI